MGPKAKWAVGAAVTVGVLLAGWLLWRALSGRRPPTAEPVVPQPPATMLWTVTVTSTPPPQPVTLTPTTVPAWTVPAWTVTVSATPTRADTDEPGPTQTPESGGAPEELPVTGGDLG